MTSRKAKGIGLISGGLDSILAARVLEDQELELIGIIFKTPFFGPGPGIDVGRTAGIPVRVIDFTDRHLEMLKNPVYGYGSQMNPCIDCHALMLREAGRVMEREGADFLFTGEVLGQRPMSQRRDSLRSVEKLCGYPGRVLRPLSARLLPPTVVEIEGLVDRERLLDIHGRSRKRQEALARHYGITDYPQPGGGCMLTKEGFARRLKELFARYPEAGSREVELLKWGRHFVLPGGSICIIGRNEADNSRLAQFAGPEDIVLRVADYPSPTGVVIASPSADRDLQLAAAIVTAYSDCPRDVPVKVSWRRGETSGTLSGPPSDRLEYRSLLI
ncbi:MAG TPA: tRNA 4-thiouridine(8) synthase ThiI [Syntrophobacter fumaroxidans]|nr:tRNA 4-thiouridine(8) synthase ThiI [Syntrophobacter fumaroxidans]